MVKEECRNKGNGSELLAKVEDYCKEKEINKLILTTDTASKFYFKHGFVKDISYKTKNKDDVYTKLLK